MKKWIGIIGLSLLFITAFIGYRYYCFIYEPNVQGKGEDPLLYIPSNADLEQVIDSLGTKDLLNDLNSFKLVASLMKYTKPKPGRYILKDAWNNRELISHLRSGDQEAVRLSFNNQRTIDELCEYLSKSFEFDSNELKAAVRSQNTMKKTGLNEFNIMTLFIPNTYQIYWTIDPDEFIDRMIKEHNRFWTSDRLEKLNTLGLSKAQCYTLASIVQKESNLESEKPRIAGVYLNRLKRGMLLQADPTVVFAIGDFEIRRVLNKHLEIDSPYNTYKYPGLPPGPIGMPDISTIDAVLNAEDHNYLYFCVKPGEGFEHAFASTLSQHNRNARRYQNWLNSNRIFN